jgi:hypothetical protein
MSNSSVDFYWRAKQSLINAGLEPEIRWQESRLPEQTSESCFLAEAAWVVYNAGFRESVVRSKFDFISLAFFDWECAKQIVSHREECIGTAMLAISNRRKHEAVVEIARIVAERGFPPVLQAILKDPVATLRGLPFIGPVTALHLAKNLGFDLAKPDRHLVRLQERFGFAEVSDMCEHLSSATGDAIRVVDLVLWRYLERQGSKVGNAARGV